MFKPIVVAAFMLAGLIVTLVSRVNNSDPDLLSEISINSPGIIQTYKLIDHNNNELTQDRFTGQWSFVFFWFYELPGCMSGNINAVGSGQKGNRKRFPVKNKACVFLC